MGIGRKFGKGLMLGVAGCDYRQVTSDSGPGAVLGPFKSRVDAIGPALNCTTTIGKTPVTFDLRHYEESSRSVLMMWRPMAMPRTE